MLALLILAKITDFAPTIKGDRNAFVLMDTQEISARKVGAESFVEWNTLNSLISFCILKNDSILS